MVIEFNHRKNQIKEQLEEITIGDKIKINSWSNFMEVRGVSDNYIVARNDLDEYTVVSKIMDDGNFFCGPDDYIFWSPLMADYDNLYEFVDPVATQKYLDDFESGKARISYRNKSEILKLEIKKVSYGTSE